MPRCCTCAPFAIWAKFVRTVDLLKSSWWEVNSLKLCCTGQEWSPFAWVPLLRRYVSISVSGFQCVFDSKSTSGFILWLELILINVFRIPIPPCWAFYFCGVTACWTHDNSPIRKRISQTWFYHDNAVMQSCGIRGRLSSPLFRCMHVTCLDQPLRMLSEYLENFLLPVRRLFI